MSSSAGDRHQHVWLGGLLMVGAGFFFALMAALIRLAAEDLHAFQVAFFRNLFGLAFMLPWVLRGGTAQLRTDRIGLYLWRGVLGMAAMLGFFWGLSVMPLAEAVSLSFAAPLFVTIGAAVILKEEVRMRRWTATVVGFLGVLIILRPGIVELSLPSIVVLLSAAGMAASILIIKELARTEPSNAIVTYMVIMMTPLSLVPAIAVWSWPPAELWIYLILLGGTGTAGHILFTNAMRVADASLVMPFDFARLPMTALFGYLMFGQTVDGWTWLGGGVIFAAGAYIAHRESQAHKQPTVAEPEL